MSCGPACIVMVAYRKLNKELDEYLVREYTQVLNQKVQVSFYRTKDYGKEKIGNTTMPSEPYRSEIGTDVGNLSIMLRKFCIETKTEFTANIISVLENATPDTPVIAQVKKQSGADHFHWVVVDGMEADRLVVMDPGQNNGLTEIPLKTTYPDLSGVLWTFTGLFLKA